MAPKYKTIKMHGKTKRIHRELFERHIGRKLTYDEIVHHIDGDTLNNDIKNLKLMKRDEHSKLHAHERTEYVTLFCAQCNKKFSRRKKYYEYKKSKGYKNTYCSHRCAGLAILNSVNKKYEKIVKEGLKKGMTGYAISKKFGLDKKTVYNHINRLKIKDKK